MMTAIAACSTPAAAQQTFGQLRYAMPKGVEERTADYVSVTDSSKNAVCRYVVLNAAPGSGADADFKAAHAEMVRIIGADVPFVAPSTRKTLPSGHVNLQGGGSGARKAGGTFYTELFVFSGGGTRLAAFRYSTSIFRCAGRNSAFENSLAPQTTVAGAPASPASPAPVASPVRPATPSPTGTPAPAPTPSPTPAPAPAPAASGNGNGPTLIAALGPGSFTSVVGTWRYKQLPRSTSEYNPITKKYEYKPQNAYLQQEFDVVLQFAANGEYVRRSDVHDISASQSQRVMERGQWQIVGDEMRFTPREAWQGVARLRQPVSLRNMSTPAAYARKIMLGDYQGYQGLHMQNPSGAFDRFQPFQP